MKFFLKLSCFFVLLLSCNSDDDCTKIIDDGFLRPELTKEFLLDEKWYLYEASIKETKEDLFSDVLSCELDSYYIFEQNDEGFVVLNQGNTECQDEFERYGTRVYPFSIDISSNSLFFETNQYLLLGGFAKAFQFREVQFLLAKDSSKKIFKGFVNVEVNGKPMNINYALISYPTDRP